LKINLVEKVIGSGFYTGFIPVASGTFGSVVAVLIYLIPGFEKLYIIIPVTLLVFFYGKFIGDKFEAVYGKDPAECTVDELVGTWISLIALPKTFLIILITFLIWRLLDIVKPQPAKKLENLPGGTGIMIDDVVSGLYTLLIMHILVYFFGSH
jgi:phosphatidylglycerophosphatase A